MYIQYCIATYAHTLPHTLLYRQTHTHIHTHTRTEIFKCAQKIQLNIAKHTDSPKHRVFPVLRKCKMGDVSCWHIQKCLHNKRDHCWREEQDKFWWSLSPHRACILVYLISNKITPVVLFYDIKPKSLTAARLFPRRAETSEESDCGRHWLKTQKKYQFWRPDTFLALSFLFWENASFYKSEGSFFLREGPGARGGGERRRAPTGSDQSNEIKEGSVLKQSRGDVLKLPRGEYLPSPQLEYTSVTKICPHVLPLHVEQSKT